VTIIHLYVLPDKKETDGVQCRLAETQEDISFCFSVFVVGRSKQDTQKRKERTKTEEKTGLARRLYDAKLLC
jgi:guanylate kinase